MKKKFQIKTPDDVAELLKSWTKKRQEHFLVITLDNSHNVIKVHCVTKGLVGNVMVHPRECFFPAIKDNALAVIFAHNHPSGSIEPSDEDKKVNHQLTMSADILGFNLLDNFIVAKGGAYYSFRREGGMETKYSEIEKLSYANQMAAELRSREAK